MRGIDLDIDKLVGYTLVKADGIRVMKLGSTKLGCKMGQEPADELSDSADRRKVDA